MDETPAPFWGSSNFLWRRSKMRLGLALVSLGVLILLDRMGAGYGIREGWPWIVVALGIGGIFSDRKSVAAWVTMIIGIFILGAKFYSLHFSIPGVVRTYFLPILLIVVGLLWVWKYQKD
jgi:predicted membrane protein